MGCFLKGLGVIFLLIIIGAFFGTNQHHTPQDSSRTSSTSDLKQQVLSSLRIDFNWKKSAFGNVMEADFTVKNPTSYDVKDIEITCIHKAPSGTVVDRNTRTIYEIFQAGSTKRIQNFNMGFIHSQAHQSSCSATDLVIIGH